MEQSSFKARRSPFLAFMAFLANLYLIGFAADAGLSLVEEILRTTANVEVLIDARNILAFIVFAFSILMLPILLFVPHLPKRVFLPLIFFAIWAGLGSLPFTPMLDDSMMQFILIAVQILAALIAFMIMKSHTGAALVAASRLPQIQKLGLRTLAAILTFIILSPIVIGGLGVIGLAAAFETGTGHYVRFTLSEINITERVFSNNEKQHVHLIGMVHMGESDAYKSLFNNFSPDALVLAEGVTDKKGLLTGNLSYKRVAKILGLEQQPALQQIGETESNITTPLGSENIPDEDSEAILKEHPDILYADSDIGDFSKFTIQFLNATTRIYDSSSISQALDRLSDLSEKFSEEDMNTVFDDILYKRNDRVLGEFDSNITKYDTIIIPWGAMHMPDLEKGLIDRGFSLNTERVIPLIRYTTILAQLKKALSFL